jgi:hypothetical protein
MSTEEKTESARAHWRPGDGKVELGIWIFPSQSKFVIVDLQKVFPVYVSVLRRH